MEVSLERKTWRELHEEQLDALNLIHDLQVAALASSESGTQELLDSIDEGRADLMTLLDCRLGEVSWQLQLQSRLLGDILATLRSPAATQAEEWRQMAEQMRARGLLREATELFSRCLEPQNNPLDYRTYVGLARTYELLGNPESALDSYTRSLVHAPRSAHLDMRSYSLRRMALIEAASGKWTNALAHSRAALEHSPQYAAAAYDAARYSAQLSDAATAMQYLRAATVASPRYLVAAQDTMLAPIRQTVVQSLAAIVLEGAIPWPRLGLAFGLAVRCHEFGESDCACQLIEHLIRSDVRFHDRVVSERSFGDDSRIRAVLEALRASAERNARAEIASATRAFKPVEEAVGRAELAREDAGSLKELSSRAAATQAHTDLNAAKLLLAEARYPGLLSAAELAASSVANSQKAVAGAAAEQTHWKAVTAVRQAEAVATFDARVRSTFGAVVLASIGGAATGFVIGGVLRHQQLRSAFEAGAAKWITISPSLPPLADGAYLWPMQCAAIAGAVTAPLAFFLYHLMQTWAATSSQLDGMIKGAVQAKSVATPTALEFRWRFAIGIVATWFVVAIVSFFRAAPSFSMPSHPIFAPLCDGVRTETLDSLGTVLTVRLQPGCWSGWVDVQNVSRWEYSMSERGMHPAMYMSTGIFIPASSDEKRRDLPNARAFRLMGKGDALVRATPSGRAKSR